MKFLPLMHKISESDAKEDLHVERISPKRGSLLNNQSTYLGHK